MSTGLVGLHACVADLHPDAIILVHTHDSYIQDDMSHRCDLLFAGTVLYSTMVNRERGVRVASQGE